MACSLIQRASVVILAVTSLQCGDATPGEVSLIPPDSGERADLGVGANDAATGDLGIEDAGSAALPAHCENGIRDESLGETEVDCGGPCRGCAFGQGCGDSSDCGFGLACGSDGLCDVASCEDGVRGEEETDVDCGGSECLTRCGVRQRCDTTSDCGGLRCVSGRCAPASCDDALLNGDETDVDCGGPSCAPCGVGSVCAVRADCPPDIDEVTPCSAADLCTLTGTQAFHRETFDCVNEVCTVDVDDRENVSCPRETEGIACASPFEAAWGECTYAQECAYLGERSRSVETSACRAGICETLSMTETSTCGSRDTNNRLCGGTPAWASVMCVQNATSNVCERRGTATRDTRRCVGQACILVEERATNSCTFDPAGINCPDTCQYRANTCTNRRQTGMRGSRRVYYTREIWRQPRTCNSGGGCAANGSGYFVERRETLQAVGLGSSGVRYDCDRNYAVPCP